MNNSTHQPTKRPMATSRMDSLPWSGASRLETSHREMARKGYPPAKATGGDVGDGEVFFREAGGYFANRKWLHCVCERFETWDVWNILFPGSPLFGEEYGRFWNASWPIFVFSTIDGNSGRIHQFFNCCTFPCSKRLQGERWNNDLVDVIYLYIYLYIYIHFLYYAIWILNGPLTATKHATHQTLEVANIIFVFF